MATVNNPNTSFNKKMKWNYRFTSALTPPDSIISTHTNGIQCS